MSLESITRVAVAVDVGGTSLKCALVSATGELLLARRVPTRRERGSDAVVATIVESAAELVASAPELQPVAAGVVVPGVVNEADGIAVWAANLDFRDVPLRAMVSERLQVPVALGHDVRAGAVAEARLGAGRAARRMLFVGIGTGIAGAYCLDGRVDPGAHGASSEIGHIVVRPGPRCGCGGMGCLEAVASASAIARAYGASSAAEVAAQVAAGDAAAIHVWQEAVEALADGLLTGIALFDPELIVVGGGLAEAGPLLVEPLAKALEERKTFHRLPVLRQAELGDEASCLGAALLAFSLLETA